MIRVREGWARGLVVVVLGTLFLGFGGCSQSPGAASVTLLYNAEEQPAEKSVVAQALQAQLAAQGISVRLDPVPSTIYNDRIAKGDFQAALSLWYLDYADPEGFLTDFYTKAGYRLSRYSDPEYDRLYLGGLLAGSEAEKMRFYGQALGRLRETLPWVPLFSNSEVFVMKPQARGFASNAYQYYDYRRVALEHIRVASDVEVQTLDPAQVYDLASKHVVTQSYEGLVALDANSRIVPALATSWEFSPDEKELTFKLRAGVKFHPSPLFATPDARTVTSADVKASLERLARSNSPYNYILDYVQGIEAFKAGKADEVSGLRTPDAQTFQIVLTRAFPTMLPWLLAPAADVLPKALPAKYEFSTGSVGTGPFILRSWNGNTAEYVANPDYWRSGEPLAKTLTLRVIKDSNTLTAAYRSDELDILNVPVSYLSQVFTEDGRVRPQWQGELVKEVPLDNLKFVAFNMEKMPWGKDEALRHRFAAALNADELVHRLLRDQGLVARTIIPAGVPGFQ